MNPETATPRGAGPTPVPDAGPTDRDCVVAAQAGRTRAFELLVRRHFGMVYAIGYARLDDADMAEDLVQEVFLRAYLGLDRLRQPDTLTAWLAQMTRNLATDWQRRGTRASRLVTMVPYDPAGHDVADDRNQGVREKMEHDQTADAVREALRGLPPEQREIVLLHFMEDLTHEQIAARLGVHRSSVSRQIGQALGRMRHSLEPVLRGAIPRLRPPSAATARAVALVGAAAALGASQKTALAAAAVTTFPGASANAAAPAATSGLSAVFALIKAAPALFTSGGTVMGLSKGVVATGVAITLAAGGTYYYATETPPPPRTAAAQPSAAAPTDGGESLIPRTTAPARVYRDWNDMVAQYMQANPDNVGLGYLASALSSMDMKTALAAKQPLDAIVANGSQANSPQLAQCLAANSKALTAAFAAAGAAPFGLPPMEDVSSPAPNFLNFQTLTKLMLATARMDEARGDADSAARRALAAMWVSRAFLGKDQSLVANLIGIAGVSKSAIVLASVLQRPGLTARTATDVLASLDHFETSGSIVAGGVRSEARCLILTSRRLKTDPKLFAGDPSAKAIGDWVAKQPDFESKVDTGFRAELANLDKPYWQRDKTDKSSMERVFGVVPPGFGNANFQEAATRADAAVARVRMCRVIAAHAAKRPEVAAAQRDPFADRALDAPGTDPVYSFGPDGTDQKGNVVYDPSNGTVSPGDILPER